MLNLRFPRPSSPLSSFIRSPSSTVCRVSDDTTRHYDRYLELSRDITLALNIRSNGYFSASKVLFNEVGPKLTAFMIQLGRYNSSVPSLQLFSSDSKPQTLLNCSQSPELATTRAHQSTIETKIDFLLTYSNAVKEDAPLFTLLETIKETHFLLSSYMKTLPLFCIGLRVVDEFDSLSLASPPTPIRPPVASI